MLRRPVLSKEIMQKHMVVSRWKSVSLLLAIHVAVVSIIALNKHYDSIGLLVLSFLFISGLQSHLLILFHEGAHMLLHPNKRINNLLSDYLCGFSFLTPVKVYRTVHLEHHRFSGHVDKDPERHIYSAMGYHYKPLSKAQLMMDLIKDVCGYSFVKSAIIFQGVYKTMEAKGRAIKLGREDSIGMLLYWVTIVSLSIWLDVWTLLLLLLLVPLFTLTYFLLKWHGYGEHTGVQGGTEYERTFVHEFNPVTNFFFYPIQSGYHLEHHLFPTIPWYNMKSFRNALAKIEDHEQARSTVTLDGVFFGQKTIYNQVIRRPNARNLRSTKNDDLIAKDTQLELEVQSEN